MRIIVLLLVLAVFPQAVFGAAATAGFEGGAQFPVIGCGGIDARLSTYVDEEHNFCILAEMGTRRSRGIIHGEDAGRLRRELTRVRDEIEQKKENMLTQENFASFMYVFKYFNYGIKLSVVSNSHGNSSIVIDIVDKENQFAKACVALNKAATEALLASLDKYLLYYESLNHNPK